MPARSSFEARARGALAPQDDGSGWLPVEAPPRIALHFIRATASTLIGKYANMRFVRQTRAISWVKAARREFEKFPAQAQATMFAALTMAAEGGKADIAKPFKGVDGGVWEIALKHRGDAYRTIYAVQIGPDLIVIDAFQKKSKSGIKTPQADVDRIKERIKRLKESL